MITDAAIAALTNGIYAYPGDAPILWDHLEKPAQDDGICFGIKRLGEVDVIVLRGSTTPEDWRRDFDCFANPCDHSFLGPVHPGFLAGMEDAWKVMRPMLGPNVIVTGHSLGAGRAAILTGLMLRDDGELKPMARVVFGEPRPGFSHLGKILSGVPARSYRNRDGIFHDLITDVPFKIGFEQYRHPCQLTDVCQPPNLPLIEQWGPFAWHSMPLYLQALQKLDASKLAATAA